MTSYEVGYLIGQSLCPLTLLALIVGGIVFAVLRGRRRRAAPRAQDWQQPQPGQPYPPQGWQPPQGQPYPPQGQPYPPQVGQPPVGPQPPYPGR